MIPDVVRLNIKQNVVSACLVRLLPYPSLHPLFQVSALHLCIPGAYSSSTTYLVVLCIAGCMGDFGDFRERRVLAGENLFVK